MTTVFPEFQEAGHQLPPFFCRAPDCDRNSGDGFQTTRGRDNHERDRHPEFQLDGEAGFEEESSEAGHQLPPFFCRAPDCDRNSGDGFQTTQDRDNHESQIHPEFQLDGEAGFEEESSAEPTAAPADLGNPQPQFLVAETTIRCQMCGQPIRQGETYVQGVSRGPTHVEPCSHRAD